MNSEELEKIVLKEDQQKAFDEMIKGEDCYVAGEAGTGKSVLIEKFITESRKKGLKVIVCAPTGMAADNINGTTVHRAFGYPIGILNADKEKKIVEYKIKGRDYVLTLEPLKYIIGDTMRSANVIIIDEISFVRMDLLELILNQVAVVNRLREENIKNHIEDKGPIQLIVTGDFGQLGPVLNQSDNKDERAVLSKIYPSFIEGYAIESEMWKNHSFKILRLNEAIRTEDIEFSKQLSKLRLGGREGIEALMWFNEHITNSWDGETTVICGTKKEVADINKQFLDKLEGQSVTFREDLKPNQGYIFGEGDRRADEIVELKVGARVMSLVNNASEGYFNSSQGVVTKLTPLSATVKFDKLDHEVIIRNYTWNIKNGEGESIGTITQIPLRLAYAMTVHKAQGQTFDKVCIKPDIYFGAAMHYTALSRVKTLEGLQFYDMNNKFTNLVHFASGFTKPIILTHEHVRKFLIENKLYSEVEDGLQ